MNRRKTTKEVAKELGLVLYRLRYLIENAIIDAPEKDDAGNFAWSERDIQAARDALAERRKPALAS